MRGAQSLCNKKITVISDNPISPIEGPILSHDQFVKRRVSTLMPDTSSNSFEKMVLLLWPRAGLFEHQEDGPESVVRIQNGPRPCLQMLSGRISIVSCSQKPLLMMILMQILVEVFTTVSCCDWVRRWSASLSRLKPEVPRLLVPVTDPTVTTAVPQCSEKTALTTTHWWKGKRSSLYKSIKHPCKAA